MKESYDLYKSQYKKAKETLEILEKHRDEIEHKIKSDPLSANFHKDLRSVNMDIRITMNEMEHAEFRIQEHESKFNSSIN